MGLTSFDPHAPSNSVFAFNPPPGATVKEGLAHQAGSDGTDPSSSVDPTTSTKPTVVGDGWSTIAIVSVLLVVRLLGQVWLFAPYNGPQFFTPHGWQAAEVRTLLKAAGKIGRLPLMMRAFALLPEADAPRGSMPWSAVCLLRRSERF